MRVAVWMGGITREREVSLDTGRAVAAALREAGHEVDEVDVRSPLQALADEGLHLIAWHLKDHRMGGDHPIAEDQFATLSKVRGSVNSALIS